MKPVIDKVFSNDSKEVKEKGLISLSRLKNLLALIEKNQKSLDEEVSNIEHQLIAEQIKINEEFLKERKEFIKDIDANFC